MQDNSPGQQAEQTTGLVQPPPPVGEPLSQLESVSAWEITRKNLPDKPLSIVFGVIVVAAVVGNIALKVGYASISMAIATALLAIAITLTKRPKGSIEYALLGLAVVSASNYLLRNSALVTFLTVLVAGSLLGAVTYRPFGQTVQGWADSISRALSDVVAAPSWFTKLLPKKSESGELGVKAGAILRGVALAVAVGLPVVLLLASGDAVFASFLDGPDVSIPGSAAGHFFLTVFLAFLALGPVLSATRQSQEISTVAKPRRALGDFKVILGSLVGVLTVWCLSQLFVALGGAEEIFAAEGLTRAEYARQGFFQLVAVAAFVITVIRYTAWRLGQRHDSDGSTGLVRILALVLAVLTLILVGVSYSRMALYIDVFDLTVTRLFVAWFLAWLAVNLLFSIYRIVKPPIPATKSSAVSFALISAAVFVTLFGWSNPEAFIVETNITAATELDAESSENGFDEFYLLELSEDATPALADNFDSLSVDSQDVFCSRGTEETYGILGYNRAVRSSNDQIDATC